MGDYPQGEWGEEESRSNGKGKEIRVLLASGPPKAMYALSKEVWGCDPFQTTEKPGSYSNLGFLLAI